MCSNTCGVVEQRMLHASKVGRETYDIGLPSWSNPSTPNTTIHTSGTARLTISPIDDNVLPTFPDHHSTSVKQPCAQQQFMRCASDCSLRENPKTLFGSTENHEKVDKSSLFG
eukprot:460847_1